MTSAMGESSRWRLGCAVLLAALTMTWPAIFNGFPILYPDSMTYLGDGPAVARAVFLHQFSGYYGMRSFFYSLVILPLHWNVSPWPIVALQALLAAWILWLTLRSLMARRRMRSYLVLVAALSLLTSLSWYVALVLPDILGALLYLAVYLIVFAGDSLGPWERRLLYAVCWWAIVSHATHLILAGGLCLLLAAVAVLGRKSSGRWKHRRLRLRPVGAIAVVVLVAAGSQLALNAYLYGRPSLNGERPPFLTARIIADGPGLRYLERHCGEVRWVVCEHRDNLSTDPDTFLWGERGLWQNLSEAESQRLMREEMPFVMATLRAYPREQISRSARNFWQQLGVFGLSDLSPSSWVLDQFAQVLPASRASYLRSRQARDELPLEWFSSLQGWVVAASLPVVLLMPLAWRGMPGRFRGLILVVLFTVVANALVTGTLSMVEDRLQSRVVWLVLMLAGLLLLSWWQQLPSAPAAQAAEKSRH